MTKEIDPRDQITKPPSNATEDDDREYEQSGLYPPGEKPFRIVRLLGSLLGVIVFIAIAAVVLDRILIQ
tara:strand:- start:2191 stop:2397 length:207 start_codon:yes stop_codon:yes gene_type:complete